MFRRRAPQVFALSSSSLRTSSVLRTEVLDGLKTSATTRSSSKTPFSFNRGLVYNSRKNLHRESRLQYCTEARPRVQSRTSLPIIIAIAGATGAVFVASTSWDKVHAEGESSSEEGEGFFSGLYKKVTGSVSQALNSSSDSPLLPDQDPPPYTKTYTLVISDDALLARSYSLQEGFATKKRPGTEYFLATLSALNYEIVLWSLQGHQTYAPMIEKLDPNHHALHRLFVDATTLSSTGKQIKDLTRLNRDLTKVIVIDVDKEGVIPQENLIIVSKYTGKGSQDTTLVDMIPFFKLIAHGKHGGDLRGWAKGMNDKGAKHYEEAYKNAVRKHNKRASQGQQRPEGDDEGDRDKSGGSFFWGRKGK